MSNLETVIAEWRTRMNGALPLREEAVAELEEHLREHVARLKRQGKSDDDAFALAQESLGGPDAVAREFDRMSVWRPKVFLLPPLALILAFLVGFSLWRWSRQLPITSLQVVFLGTYVTGYFGIFGAGLIATSAFLTTWWRPLRECERHAVRRLLRRLAWLSVVLIPLGLTLGTLWKAQFDLNHSPHWSYQLRFTLPLVSVALLAFVQFRSAVSDQVRWLTAIFAAPVFFMSMFGPSIRVADIPVALLGVVFLSGQLLVALPGFRFPFVRLREPN